MKIACMQVAPAAGDISENLARLEAAAHKARAEGCALLLTPEMFLTGYNIGAREVRRMAQPCDGSYAQAVAGIARKAGLALLYGYPESCTSTGEVFNSVQLIDAAGHALLNYRKTHLFGEVDRAQFSAGEARSAVIRVNGWNVALAICYDIEFPELSRAYAQDGAELILTPTANMLPYVGVANRLVPARAEENGLYVAYANYCGSEGGFDYCGLSCVCGPDGNDLARAGQGEALIVAELSRSKLEQTRREVSYLADVRPDIYVPRCGEKNHG